MLPIHHRCTTRDAIAEFGGHAEMWCDGQFVVLPKAVLCFFIVGPNYSESHLPQPSTVNWKPQKLDYAPRDEYSWFPTPVREVYDRSSTKNVRLRSHYIFIRTIDMDDFYYVGEAHLGSYGGPQGNAPGNREACFSLNEKVPRDIWLACGGYDGWKVEIDHSEVIATDITTMERGLLQLKSDAYSHFCMTRYEEDSLTIYTNPKGRSWLMYLRQPDDCGLYVYSPDKGTVLENFHCCCGIDLDFPANQTLPHAAAARIVHSLFESGELPKDVNWTDEF